MCNRKPSDFVPGIIFEPVTKRPLKVYDALPVPPADGSFVLAQTLHVTEWKR